MGLKRAFKCGHPRGEERECRPCAAERARRWRDQNHERATQSQRDRYHADVEASRADARAYKQARIERSKEIGRRGSRAYAERHPDRRKEQKVRYVHTHPEQIAAENCRARSRKAGVDPAIAATDVAWLKKRSSGKCEDCRCPFVARDPKWRFTVGHMIPISKGGGNDRSNLIAQCWDCNRRQGDCVHSGAAR